MFIRYKDEYTDERSRANGVWIPGQRSLLDLPGEREVKICFHTNWVGLEMFGVVEVICSVEEANNLARRILVSTGELDGAGDIKGSERDGT